MCCTGAALSQRGKHCFARAAVVAEDAHLDQAVRSKRRVGFFLYGVRQAVAADRHHRVEVMRSGTVFAALGGGENEGGHSRIIRSP
jgi:hypothetical protein